MSPTTLLGALNRAHSADAHGTGSKTECGLPLGKPGPHEGTCFQRDWRVGEGLLAEGLSAGSRGHSRARRRPGSVPSPSSFSRRLTPLSAQLRPCSSSRKSPPVGITWPSFPTYPLHRVPSGPWAPGGTDLPTFCLYSLDGLPLRAQCWARVTAWTSEALRRGMPPETRQAEAGLDQRLRRGQSIGNRVRRGGSEGPG